MSKAFEGTHGAVSGLRVLSGVSNRERVLQIGHRGSDPRLSLWVPKMWIAAGVAAV
jgi:hypothetical protein